MAVENRADLQPIKTRYHVPADLEACHTAVIEAYVIEGHVPADVLSRLLRERPKILGLAMPGMPAGSAGVETACSSGEPYQVLMFGSGRTVGIFATCSGG